jgi:hypothetical protein
MTPNDIVEIKPTEEGWLEIVKYVDETNDRLRKKPRLRYRMRVPTPDADGYIRGQFWTLMQFFNWAGSHLGGDIYFHDLRIPPAPESKESKPECQPTKYPWEDSSIPSWVQWIATDEDGRVEGYKEVPAQGRAFWADRWDSQKALPLAPYPGDWRESLEQRPMDTLS